MNIGMLAKEQRIRELTIYVATGEGSCPLRCSYCFLEKAGPTRFMSPRTLRQAVDFLRGVCDRPKALRFFGMEPLARFGLLQHARDYAPDLELSVTTNGWLLTDARIAWLAQHQVRVFVYSIDGGPEHHRHRLTRRGQPTWRRVAENFQKLLPSQGEWITTRATWAPTDGDYDLVGRFRALEALGARSIAVIPAIGVRGWDEARVARAYQDLADYYGERSAPSRFITQALARLEVGDTRPRGNCCNAGRFAWSVAPNGDLFLCHQGLDWPEWRVGSVYSTVANEAAIAVSRRVDQFTPCEGCHARTLCMGPGWCAAENLRHTGDVIIPPPGYCAHLRGMTTGLKYWLSLRHHERARQWLGLVSGGVSNV